MVTCLKRNVFWTLCWHLGFILAAGTKGINEKWEQFYKDLFENEEFSSIKQNIINIEDPEKFETNAYQFYMRFKEILIQETKVVSLEN